MRGRGTFVLPLSSISTISKTHPALTFAHTYFTPPAHPQSEAMTHLAANTVELMSSITPSSTTEASKSDDFKFDLYDWVREKSTVQPHPLAKMQQVDGNGIVSSFAEACSSCGRVKHQICRKLTRGSC